MVNLLGNTGQGAYLVCAVPAKSCMLQLTYKTLIWLRGKGKKFSFFPRGTLFGKIGRWIFQYWEYGKKLSLEKKNRQSKLLAPVCILHAFNSREVEEILFLLLFAKSHCEKFPGRAPSGSSTFVPPPPSSLLFIPFV